MPLKAVPSLLRRPGVSPGNSSTPGVTGRGHPTLQNPTECSLGFSHQELGKARPRLHFPLPPSQAQWVPSTGPCHTPN